MSKENVREGKHGVILTMCLFPGMSACPGHSHLAQGTCCGSGDSLAMSVPRGNSQLPPRRLHPNEGPSARDLGGVLVSPRLVTDPVPGRLLQLMPVAVHFSPPFWKSC